MYWNRAINGRITAVEPSYLPRQHHLPEAVVVGVVLPGLQAKGRPRTARRRRLLSPPRGFWGLVVDPLPGAYAARLYAVALSGLRPRKIDAALDDGEEDLAEEL
jgi:hypothetical protein